MKKGLFLLCLVTISFILSCSNEINKERVIEKESLSINEGLKFKSVIDSINRINYPYICVGKTRVADNNVDEDIILTSEEEEILRSNEKALIDASYALFETIGLTKNEIISELGEGNENAVVYASLIATSIVLDNSITTRGITGNSYVDCALDVLGFDLISTVRTAMTEGISKKVALKLIKQSIKTTLKSSVVVSVGLWGLCMGFS